MSYLERNFRATEELNRRTILSVLEPRPGGVLLDLGCGDGALTDRVAERVQATRKLGVETWEPFAAQARARGIEVFDVDLGQRLPFDDGAIDVVHSNQVIEHLPFTDHFLKEIRRILRPGGQAVVSTNNLASWHNIVSLVLGWQPMPCHVSDDVIVGNPAGLMEGASGTPGQMHLRIFTSRALAQLAEHHGLEVQVEQTAGYYPLPPPLARLATLVDRRHGAFLVQRYGVPA